MASTTSDNVTVTRVLFAFGKKIALAELYEKYESSRNFGRSCQNLLLSFPHAYPLNTLRIPPDPVPWASNSRLIFRSQTSKRACTVVLGGHQAGNAKWSRAQVWSLAGPHSLQTRFFTRLNRS